MYSSPNFQILDLVINVLEVIKDDKGIDIEIVTQFEPTIYTENERKAFYTSYNREDEQENINFNHRKIPTFYFPPKCRNLLAIHLLSKLLSKPKSKYRTSICQQRLVQDPGACLVYQPHRYFLAYLNDSERISIIVETATVVDSVIYEHLYKPISQYITSHIYITPYTLLAQMLRSGSNSLPAFLKCGKYYKWGTIFGLCLPDLAVE